MAFLRTAFGKHGHTLAHAVERDADLERVLSEPIDVVVASGGDGTVRRAATAIAGRGIPLAILPLGTANNIARSLGVRGTISHVIDSWDTSRVILVDIGIAEGPWGSCSMLEGVGGGLVPAGIRAFQIDSGGKDDVSAVLARAATTYLDVLSALPPRRVKVTADTRQMEADCLLVEVLNISCIGPNLAFGGQANPSDGLFTVVTAGEEHRGALVEYLQGRAERRECEIDLPRWQARRVVVEGFEQVHVDDTVHRWPTTRPFSLSMSTLAVPVLAPETNNTERNHTGTETQRNI